MRGLGALVAGAQRQGIGVAVGMGSRGDVSTQREAAWRGAASFRRRVGIDR